jgi:hypothetical protein
VTSCGPTAAVVRAAPAAGRWAVLSEPVAAELLGSFLDSAAEHLDVMDGQLRAHVVRVAAELVGRPMDQPTIRRTRRRR